MIDTYLELSVMVLGSWEMRMWLMEWGFSLGERDKGEYL